MTSQDIVEATRVEISLWETENQNKIIRWTRDFEKDTVQYCFDDKCVESKTFKIIS